MINTKKDLWKAHIFGEGILFTNSNHPLENTLQELKENPEYHYLGRVCGIGRDELKVNITNKMRNHMAFRSIGDPDNFPVGMRGFMPIKKHEDFFGLREVFKTQEESEKYHKKKKAKKDKES